VARQSGAPCKDHDSIKAVLEDAVVVGGNDAQQVRAGAEYGPAVSAFIGRDAPVP